MLNQSRKGVLGALEIAMIVVAVGILGFVGWRVMSDADKVVTDAENSSEETAVDAVEEELLPIPDKLDLNYPDTWGEPTYLSQKELAGNSRLGSRILEFQETGYDPENISKYSDMGLGNASSFANNINVIEYSKSNFEDITLENYYIELETIITPSGRTVRHFEGGGGEPNDDGTVSESITHILVLPENSVHKNFAVEYRRQMSYPQETTPPEWGSEDYIKQLNAQIFDIFEQYLDKQ